VEEIDFRDLPRLSSLQLQGNATLESVHLQDCPKLKNLDLTLSRGLRHVSLVKLTSLEEVITFGCSALMQNNNNHALDIQECPKVVVQQMPIDVSMGLEAQALEQF